MLEGGKILEREGRPAAPQCPGAHVTPEVGRLEFRCHSGHSFQGIPRYCSGCGSQVEVFLPVPLLRALLVLLQLVFGLLRTPYWYLVGQHVLSSTYAF